ncbi:hypothetical protein CL689_06045 [Candidatus Saccharibacteria bacterium]|nr:hypothetical protein [Candidatus Saccharibacteria bacterium]
MIFPKYGRRYLINHLGQLSFAVLTGIGPSYYQMQDDKGRILRAGFKSLLRECPVPEVEEPILEEDAL